MSFLWMSVENSKNPTICPPSSFGRIVDRPHRKNGPEHCDVLFPRTPTLGSIIRMMMMMLSRRSTADSFAVGHSPVRWISSSSYARTCRLNAGTSRSIIFGESSELRVCSLFYVYGPGLCVCAWHLCGTRYSLQIPWQ